MNPSQAPQTYYIHGRTADERSRLALMNRLINPACLQALGLAAERKILDVGCGTGQFTRLMAEQLPDTATVVAIERDPGQLEGALQAPLPGCGAHVDYRLGDAMTLDLPAPEWGSFDLAHTRFLLEHVDDPQAVVRHMVSAVRPGGRVVLLDDDHELLRLWPEPPGVLAAWRAYYRTYDRLGTDPLVGRRLCELLQTAGARPTRITQLFYGACSGEDAFPGLVTNLVGVLEGARESVLAGGEINAGEFDHAVANLRDFAAREGAALWYVINWAEGRRAP